jgi:hypothetical protein
MTTATFSAKLPSVSPSRAAAITGHIATGLAVAFLAFDSVIKLARIGPALEGGNQLGFAASDILTLGIIEFTLLVVYLVPRTAILGAVLWTGYLGGAIVIHFRLHNPLFSHILFPTYVGLLLWGGLWLRDARLRALFPLRSAR